MTDDLVTTDEETDVTFNVTTNDAVFLPQPNTVDLNTSLFGRQTSITTAEGKYSVNSSGDVTFEPVRNFFWSGDAAICYELRIPGTYRRYGDDLRYSKWS